MADNALTVSNPFPISPGFAIGIGVFALVAVVSLKLLLHHGIPSTTDCARPAREGASSDDNPTSRNQSTTNTAFKDGKNSAHAATGSRATGPGASNARNNSQGHRNTTDEGIKISNVSMTGGRGGYGRRRGGNGGHTAGSVTINAQIVNIYNQRS
ncbi:hypothetical protein MSAN_01841700 [Mycena sanguinolenta]|uniref:Uncharacterized protein n=1 Tax=Mycena sanguinolenta TaxID=230812 RepID=A0A8H7CQ71_9AGAR|nr:hypothetical protein MSAN_01841700 [Mycena sanguinolenta]